MEGGRAGYSKTNTGKTKQSRWHHAQQKKKQEMEKIELQKTYGNISRFFESSLTQSQPGSQLDAPPDYTPSPSPPPLRLTWPDRPPGLLASFDTAFFRSISFKEDIQHLDEWCKTHKKELVGDWMTRVSGVRDLLMFQGSFVYTATPVEEREHKWKDHSESISLRLGKGPKFAYFLRQWERDWFECRIPPPCPMKGKHVKRQSLYNDEGVILAVREYLNTALWHANPWGVCTAVQGYLQSKSVYNIMQIDSILTNTSTTEAKSGISERTAQRWLIKLGWVYGRNKKGYCDGYEREDVVEYRQKEFCPRMQVMI
jgi:hypothetical protein